MAKIQLKHIYKKFEGNVSAVSDFDFPMEKAHLFDGITGKRLP